VAGLQIRSSSGVRQQRIPRASPDKTRHGRSRKHCLAHFPVTTIVWLSKGFDVSSRTSSIDILLSTLGSARTHPISRLLNALGQIR
jgi:hypothetical protein